MKSSQCLSHIASYGLLSNKISIMFKNTLCGKGEVDVNEEIFYFFPELHEYPQYSIRTRLSVVLQRFNLELWCQTRFQNESKICFFFFLLLVISRSCNNNNNWNHTKSEFTIRSAVDLCFCRYLGLKTKKNRFENI